jgi:hypothetical protein
MLTFQVIEGYSCFEHVVLIGDTKKSKRCKWPHLTSFVLMFYSFSTIELSNMWKVLKVLH